MVNGLFERDFALVSWREVARVGEFVKCRRGTGEMGWWHDHKDGYITAGIQPTTTARARAISAATVEQNFRRILGWGRAV